MYITHIVGALLTLAVTVFAARALASQQKQAVLRNYAIAIAGLSLLQYITGVLMTIATGEVVRGCVSLAIYTLVIVAVEAVLLSRIAETKKNPLPQ